MWSLIRLIDRQLRRRQSIIELSQDPRLLLRVRVTAVPPASPTTAAAPSPAEFLELHLWNERISPPLPTGPTFAWGVRARHAVAYSLSIVAAALLEDPGLAKVLLIGGVMSVRPARRGQSPERLLRRLGFLAVPHRTGNVLREVGERFHFWLLSQLFSPSRVRRHHRQRTCRIDFRMSAEELVRRYAPGTRSLN